MGRWRERPICRMCQKPWRRMSTVTSDLCQICAGERRPWERDGTNAAALADSPAIWCRRCCAHGVRKYAQSPRGLCRAHEDEELGMVATAERQAYEAARRQLKLELEHLRPAPPVPRERRELVVDGVVYEVESSSERVVTAEEFARELEAARNPVGWAADGSPWRLTRKRGQA